ncbi:major facilitator superfamily domain-containing protein [Desarmillaria tabescens]|uniref:Major facilitator superfamily domain-containing protein n=1 Tax=Armillaria tabescens TaxID=1929756 RepID=A0AA39N425_ARMTA|nr:major facilitator superfamily domain-containing protein [Desarmillaria tabescens]KAK0457187.1 major facilitator superfamily domain-containing protein [Desarmillaria tabescens]
MNLKTYILRRSAASPYYFEYEGPEEKLEPPTRNPEVLLARQPSKPGFGYHFCIYTGDVTSGTAIQLTNPFNRMFPRADHGEAEEYYWGWKWRSSYWFVTFVMWLGTVVDVLTFALSIPVVPFQLKALGYKDVVSLNGWLLFAYSAGGIIASVPVALWSEAYNTQRLPYITGVLTLIVSQIMFMEAPSYWVMCFARCLQGAGNYTRLVVGSALLCDRSPSRVVGRQLGIMMSGVLLGMLIGTPIGGPLYARFGFRSSSPAHPGTPPSSIISDHIPLERKELDNKEIGATVQSDEARISFVKAFCLLLQSHRALGAVCVSAIIAILEGMLTTVLPSHLNSVWGLDASEVGLVLLASIIPTIFAPPISGWLADRFGVSIVIMITLISAMPGYIVMILDVHLALLIAAYACASLATLVFTECASIARTTGGVNYAHVYALSNLTYAIGSSVGPIVGGQMYDNIAEGWMAICLMAVGLLALCMVVALFLIGGKPIGRSLLQRL